MFVPLGAVVVAANTHCYTATRPYQPTSASHRSNCNCNRNSTFPFHGIHRSSDRTDSGKLLAALVAVVVAVAALMVVAALVAAQLGVLRHIAIPSQAEAGEGAPYGTSCHAASAGVHVMQIVVIVLPVVVAVAALVVVAALVAAQLGVSRLAIVTAEQIVAIAPTNQLDRLGVPRPA